MYSESDRNTILDIFKTHHVDSNEKQDCLIDYFGVVNSMACVPHLAGRMGTVLKDPPYPSDTFRASYIEYLALIESIDKAEGPCYQMAEIGASYAPFAALSGKLALRSGKFEKIKLITVEAASNGAEKIKQNFNINGLSNAPEVELQIIKAAVSSKRQKLYFPDVDCTVDNGAMASNNNDNIDYRGQNHSFVEVDAIPLDEVIQQFDKSPKIDFLHIDIQGSEYEVVHNAVGLLNTCVKRMMIATHSRLIEGKLLDLLHVNSWNLLAEEPTQFRYNKNLKNVIGMTSHDGSMYWVNGSLLK